MDGVKIRRDCRRRDEIVLVTPSRAFTSGPCSFFSSFFLSFFFDRKILGLVVACRSKSFPRICVYHRAPSNYLFPLLSLERFRFEFVKKMIATISIFYDKNYQRLFTVFTKQSFLPSPPPRPFFLAFSKLRKFSSLNGLRIFLFSSSSIYSTSWNFVFVLALPSLFSFPSFSFVSVIRVLPRRAQWNSLPKLIKSCHRYKLLENKFCKHLHRKTRGQSISWG